MKLRSFYLVSLSLLTIWFSLVFIDASPLIQDGALSLVSLQGLFLLFLVLSLAGTIFRVGLVNVFTFFYTGYWLYIQWSVHWKMTILGVSEEKVARYNDMYHGTMRLFPESSTLVVPDLYHIVLSALILITFVLVIFKLLTFNR